ncbi:MAG: hypothetical protein SGPRY_003753, partial [Prymnesium sp.]
MLGLAIRITIVLYVILILLFTTRALVFGDANGSNAEISPLSSAVTECKWKGFGCSKGCVFRGKCVPRKDKSSPYSQTGRPISTAKADSLMKHRTTSNCLEAADIYESAALSASSSETQATLRLRAGEALICAMRIKTNGNLLVLEGTQESPAFKQYWASHGPRALAHVRAAKTALPDSFAVASAEMDAFLFANSAKGIIRQAVTGAGVEYTRLANGLISNYETSDGGAGHCYLGGFYAVAPWPLGNANRALSEMTAALEIEPKSRRNNYY